MTTQIPSSIVSARIRPMPPKGTIGLALAAYKLWRRLPPAQRAAVFNQARKHGPKAAAAAGALIKSRKHSK
jgi:hypothetical protein